jgi:hypothetical protein
MKIFSSKPSAGAPAPSFIGFVFSLTGWAFIEVWLIGRHVSPRTHLVPALIALYLALSSIRRSKLAREDFRREDHLPAPQWDKLGAKQLGWALILLFAGATMGALIGTNSMFFVGIGAVGLSYVPWSRVPLCRDHLIVASLAMCTGMALPMLITYRNLDLIFPLLTAWVFWTCAVFTVLGQIVQRWQLERSIKSAAKTGAK